MQKTYTLYILICGKGEYYTGISSDLDSRLRSHQLEDKEFSHNLKQWTKYHQPVTLAFKYEGLENLSVALKVERYTKSLKKEDKSLLISGNTYRLKMLKRIHHTHLTKYTKSNTFERFSQTQYPYIAHIQK